MPTVSFRNQGLGAVWNTCKVEVDSSVCVFGLGAVGLAVIQGAKMAGASRIIAVDINPDKFVAAKELGATDCVDSSKLDKPVQQHIVEMTKWGGEICSNFVALFDHFDDELERLILSSYFPS